MPLLANDTLTQLAFSVHENRGVFALLLGSGLSRAAEIPTGWEITADLIRRVAGLREVEEQPDWFEWYRAETGENADYSALLQELAASPEERRAILHRYIEPTEEDREAGRKVPTPAHYAVAELVRDGFVRVVVTTNFDRLLESALRERGVEPTVVASVDALAGAEPLTHTKCYVLKLHGDYKDARILNTQAELSNYPPAYERLLDQIFDEHGLVVCGWSGEWDDALRAALLRAPNRRYSAFWAARGALGSGAQGIADHRRARIIHIEDADGFFSGLRDRVETLAATDQRNPMSTDLVLASTKRFLARPEFRIQLEDLFAQETDRLLSRLASSDFSTPGEVEAIGFRLRVHRYEAAAEALALMAGAIGRWGDADAVALATEAVKSLHEHGRKVRSGFTVYLGLRSYPAVLVFTALALGLVRSERWGALHRLFRLVIERENGRSFPLVEVLFLDAWDSVARHWRMVEGLADKRTPLSEHLLGLFSRWGARFVGVSARFELLYERFEMLGSLAFLERTERSEIEQALNVPNSRSYTLMPVGRSGWNHDTARVVLEELRSPETRRALCEAGFGRGEPEFVETFCRNFERAMQQMVFPWA